MCSKQEMQRIDQELSSELIEPPINPLFVNMRPPFVGKYTLLSSNQWIPSLGMAKTEYGLRPYLRVPSRWFS